MPPRPSPFQTGDVVPGTKYRVLGELGAGGMGIVYRVEKPPQIQGVLKLMSKDLASSPEFRTRFFDEVRILAQLDHPNIVRVFDYDALPDGTPYYVMELLQGRTLRDAIATMGRLPARVAFEITRQLLEALHCAHTHDVPVVHRDIKPENIFLHAPRHGEPIVKLIDFGVIAVADRKHDGMFVGTWRYAAPEQIRGERASPATDLYAVGLILYEMLAGRGPFDEHDAGSLVSQAHLREIPPPISQLVPWVPASIARLVSAALAKDPGARPRDAYAFAEQLYELASVSDAGAESGAATPAGPIATVLSTIAERGAISSEKRELDVPPPRSRKRRWILALAILTLATIGIMALPRLVREPPPARPLEPAAEPPPPASAAAARAPTPAPTPATSNASAPASASAATPIVRARAPLPLRPARSVTPPASAAPKPPRDDFMRGGP